MLVNMKEMLAKAQKEQYGIGFFNAVNVEMARAIIQTAEELHAPVIVGTAEVLLPAMKCMEALKLGFSSVMYDCSTASYEENLDRVAEMVRVCHGMGVTVEGELGHVGDNEGAGKLENPSDYFTDPAVAADFVRKTGVDALAVAVGNAHGDYKFPPKLDFSRITAIREAVRRGVCKINIFTDLDKAGKAGIEKGLKNGAASMMELIPYEIEAMKEVVRNKIGLFGSDGRA